MWHVPNAPLYAVAGALALCAFLLARLAMAYHAILKFQLKHDAPTDLPNRVGFEETLSQALADADSGGLSIAVQFISLDGFRQVNDLQGYAAGDDFLKQMGACIEGSLRRGDTLARVGGDEFAVLLDTVDSTAVTAMPERILAAIRNCSAVYAPDAGVTASIGLSLFPDHARTAAALLRMADIAMRESKADGGDSFAVCDAARSRTDFRRSDAVALIRSAIDNDGFRLMFQPLISQGGFVAQVEALLRIHDLPRGIVRPDEFLGVAEQTGLIHQMGAWIFQAACRQARAWHDEGYRVPVAVNVSPAQLQAPGFAGEVLACLSGAGLPAAALVIEVTQSGMARDRNHAEAALRRLRAAGVAVSLDYSEAIAPGLPVDNIKICAALAPQMLAQAVRQVKGAGYRAVSKASKKSRSSTVCARPGPISCRATLSRLRSNARMPPNFSPATLRRR